MVDEPILIALDPGSGERIEGLCPPPEMLTELIMEAVVVHRRLPGRGQVGSQQVQPVSEPGRHVGLRACPVRA